jgi:hypothetical protein
MSERDSKRAFAARPSDAEARLRRPGSRRREIQSQVSTPRGSRSTSLPDSAGASRSPPFSAD